MIFKNWHRSATSVLYYVPVEEVTSNKPSAHCNIHLPGSTQEKPWETATMQQQTQQTKHHKRRRAALRRVLISMGMVWLGSGVGSAPWWNFSSWQMLCSLNEARRKRRADRFQQTTHADNLCSLFFRLNNTGAFVFFFFFPLTCSGLISSNSLWREAKRQNCPIRTHGGVFGNAVMWRAGSSDGVYVAGMRGDLYKQVLL